MDCGREVGGAGKGASGGGDMVSIMRVGGAEELLSVYRAGDVLRGPVSALVLALLMCARSDEAIRGVGVKDVKDEIGVPDSSFDSNRLGSPVVGEAGP